MFVPNTGPIVPGTGTTTVADALFTKVQQCVLAVLFGNPARSFYAQEIITLAGSGTGPVFAELRSLVLKTSSLVDVLRAALAPLAREIRAAFVFGSVAKREDTAASDVDLLVISERLTYAELYEMLQPVESRIGRTVNPTVFTPAELARRVRQENAFVTRVLDGPKLWMLGGPDDLPAR